MGFVKGGRASTDPVVIELIAVSSAAGLQKTPPAMVAAAHDTMFKIEPLGKKRNQDSLPSHVAGTANDLPWTFPALVIALSGEKG